MQKLRKTFEIEIYADFFKDGKLDTSRMIQNYTRYESANLLRQDINQEVKNLVNASNDPTRGIVKNNGKVIDIFTNY